MMMKMKKNLRKVLRKLLLMMRMKKNLRRIQRKLMMMKMKMMKKNLRKT